jgi:hypothetical protein
VIVKRALESFARWHLRLDAKLTPVTCFHRMPGGGSCRRAES